MKWTVANLVLLASVVSGLSSCRSSDDAVAEDEDQAQQGLDDGTCTIEGRNGKHYIFNPQARVCWVQFPGPVGTADNVYMLRNTSSVTRRMRIRLVSLPDTKCYTVPGGGL